MLKLWLRRWGPAAVMMALIFLFSARPSDEMPSFGILDYVVKKGGHMLGYGLLALAYWHGLGLAGNRKGIAWGLAIGYAITDEIHQSFVPGRNPSVMDVLVFDNLGAILALTLWDLLGRVMRRQKSERVRGSFTTESTENTEKTL